MTNLYLAVLLLVFSVNTSFVVQDDPPPSKELPNIIWLVAEDLSPIIPPFGDSTVQTPNLSRLAAEGVRYTNFYSVAGVCAPSRAGIATGMYPSSIGAHNMRTGTSGHLKTLGLPFYETVPPSEVKMMSQLLREEGYYCTNNNKNDYQFTAPVTAWDENSNYAHWRNRPEGQPFFAVFNFAITHESQVFGPYRKTNQRFHENFPDRNAQHQWNDSVDSSDWYWNIPEDLEVPIPPYLADTEGTRNDVRRVYSNIVEMDKQVGVILDQLEADGLLDNTIIFWYTDHGGPLPRQKRLLYDSGLKVPLIIRFPDQKRAGEVDDQLLSFIDLAPTVFSLAGIEPPEHLQGQAFLGAYQSKSERNYIHAAADRLDTEYDMIRAVRDKQFKYLHNFKPDRAYYLEVKYRERMVAMQELLRLRDEGKLNEYQMQWFRSDKPEEELFDTWKDPHELHNLADDPAYAEKLTELRKECYRWMASINDKGFIPEKELIYQMWQGQEKPQTAKPECEKLRNGRMRVTCTTPGANIGYQLLEKGEEKTSWKVYTEPFFVPVDTPFKVVAHRLGYLPSEVVAPEN